MNKDNKNNNLWIWGYVLPQVPGKMLYVNPDTHCSIETAANYVNADNVIFMDSTTSVENLNENYFSHVKDLKQVICGLDHHCYAKCAEAVSKFSLTHPTITGAIIDDFRATTAPSKNMTVPELKEVYEALKSKNPNLKLWVVRYSHQDFHGIDAYLDYIDGINYWVWVSSDHYWMARYQEDLWVLVEQLKKPILQGIFLHDYGYSNGPQPMQQLKLQLPLIGSALRTKILDGAILLQNGWFSQEDHREVVQYTKEYFDWFYGTITK
jgi:hypothetical protein